MWLSYFWISKYIEGPYVAKAPTPFVYSCFLCLRLHLNIRMIAHKDTNATISSTFKHVRFKLVRSKVHRNQVAQTLTSSVGWRVGHSLDERRC